MAVDWRMALTQTGGEAMNYIQAFETGRKSAEERNLMRRREEGRAQASQQLATGNVSGAQQTAINAGDFDYAKALSGYSEDQRKQFDAEAEAMGSTAFSLKSLPKEQREAGFRTAAQRLRGLFGPEELQQAYQQLQAQGWSDEALDAYVNQAVSAKDALASYTKMNEQYTLAPGSARYDAKGNLVRQQPFAPRITSVAPGETVVEIQPGGGDPASGGGGALSVDSVLPHIVAQESGGNYSARNASTGALGAYQVMPATGQALAERLGLPWRPELMASNSPEGRAYQDQIGRAAVEEAVNASGGDPATMASYYHGGSDRSKWGPNTRRYAQDVVGRLGGGTRVIAQGAPKEGYRTLSPQEAQDRGLPAGSVYQISPQGQISAVSGTGSAGSSRKAEADLRKEFNGLPEVKSFRTVKAQGETILRLARDQEARLKKGGEPTPQNDIAMIFSYMKMLDPTSVVREGEFATAQNAAGVPDRIRNAYNKAQSGQLMNPKQRRDMVNAARQVFIAARRTYNERAGEYRGYAADYDVDPERIAKPDNDRPRRGTPAKPSSGWGKATVVR